MKLHIESYDEIDSTNSVVKARMAQGQAEGFVCRSLRQTKGYGRQGRTWVSLEGGSYQSLLLQPKRQKDEWPTLTLIVGLAVRRALLDCLDVPDEAIYLKWPNDVMTKEGKLVGISCESRGNDVCVGVGVNVFHPQDLIVIQGKNKAAYLVDLLPHELSKEAKDIIAQVSDNVLDMIISYYKIWQQKGFDAFLNEYRAANGILGYFIRLKLIDGGMLAVGRVVDVNKDGQLVIEDQEGTIKAYSSGEVHILKLEYEKRASALFSL